MALVQLAATDCAIASMTALRALKPLGPAHPKQGTPALFFRAVLGEKLRQTYPFLELNDIFGHGVLLVCECLEHYDIGGRSNSDPPPKKTG